MIFTVQSDESSAFKTYLGKMLQVHSPGCKVIRISRHSQVYKAGERDDNVYLIESGCIKLLWPTSSENEGLVAIYSAGDLFGESCLGDETSRSETAIAMEDSTIWQISRDAFMAVLGRDILLKSMVQYLVTRVCARQQTIASLLAVNKEHRIALTLLHLCRQLGKSDPNGMRIDQKICQRELAAMTGTTRARIGIFLKRFEQLGLVKRSKERFLVIDELKVHGYLTMIVPGKGMNADRVQ